MPPQLYEFHLPLSPEDLLKSGGVNQYVVQEVLPIRQLQPQLKAFQAAFRAQGPLAILQHFDTVYSILHHFRSVDVGLKEETLEFLIKVVSRHSQELPAILEDAGLSGPDRRAHLNALKMNCYALIRLLEALETARSQESLADLDAGAKGKKARSRAAAGFEWEEERQPVLQLLTQLLQLDIRHLWKHSVIEEEFVSLVTGCGYRLLENPAIGHQRNRPTREAIAHLLGVALTRYNHMLSATVKVIQMLQHFEHLAPVLVAAVSLWATEYGMKSVVGEIVREMGEKCPQEPGRDPGRARGFAAFLTELAERVPAVLMSSVCVLLDHLDGENYVMRNAVLAAMAEMVLQVLRGDELEAAARATRDQFLDTLQAHGHDVHSFVRSRVLQLFTRIVQQKALPLTRFQAVVALAVGRLADKSVLVCKNAIQLLASFVANNPFSCKLSDADLAAPLQRETQKLEEMRAEMRAKAPALEPEEEWEAMLPELRATLRGLLAPPPEDEEDEGDEGAPEPVGPIADGEGAAQVTARIRQLLARASYRQAVLLAREAARRFPDAEPFRDDEDPAQDTPEGAAEEPPEDTPEDAPEGAEGRLLRLLGRVFKGPARGTRGPDRGPADGEAEAEPRGPQGDGGAELVKQELLVQYLRDAHSFARSLAQAVGAIGAMMYEHAATVVQEVIEFFVTVFRFGVPQAVGGVRRMLPLVWSKEPGVREAVLGAYRQLYLSPEGGSARARAQALIQNLSALLVGASAGALQCLEEILSEFVRQEEVPPAATQLLWERVAGKAPCAPGDRRAAVLLLGMMARGRPELVGSNLELLVGAGLEQGARPDYRLAQQVCLAIANISDARKPTPGARAPPFRLPQDHRLFQRLRDMVTEGFAHPDPLWVPFKETAVALTYQLAEGPDALCAQMLQACARHALDSLEEGPEAGAPRLRAVLLLQLLSLAGDVALQQLLHLEQAVGAELGRRRALREEEGRAPPGPAAPEQGAGADTALEEELGLAGGASADDTEAELVRGICDTELLEGRQVLAAFAPLVVRVCQGPGVFGQPELCAAAALALGKFCMVSAAFCESQLRLVFTLLEKSAPPAARANLMAAAGDLAVRFPNLLDPWTPHLYARLRDPAPQVRKTAGLVLTHLILKDMVKVKGQVSEMAALLVDPEPPIAALARSFFHELSHKGNAIYNLLPDMVSRLSDPEGGVEEEPFRAIMRHLLGYITKEKQLESLVEKLCQRFRTAGTERQQRDLAFCVAQLPLGERGVRRLLELLPCLAGALGDPAVHAALLPLAARLRRGARPDARALADEFEQKLRACHTRGLDGADEPEPAAGTASQPAPPAKKRVPRPQPAASDDFATPEPRRAPRPPRTGRKKTTQVVFSSSDEASASDGELSAEMTEEETPKKTTPLRRASRRPRS